MGDSNAQARNAVRGLWRDSQDPPVARILWVLIVAGGVGIAASPILHYPISGMLPILGGLVVILGSYFAARTLRDNEMVHAIEMLDSDEESVQLMGIYTLGRVAKVAPMYRPFVAGILVTHREKNGVDGLRGQVIERLIQQLPDPAIEIEKSGRAARRPAASAERLLPDA
jgi:hypothetical protein